MRRSFRPLRSLIQGRNVASAPDTRWLCFAQRRARADKQGANTGVASLHGFHDRRPAGVEAGGRDGHRKALFTQSRAIQSAPRRQSPNGQLSRVLPPASSQKVSPAGRPASGSDAQAKLPEQVRSVLRLLTNPIVVCTATHNGTPRAMTMSSFISLTLSPTPLVSFNIATPSRTLDAIAASQEFNIHILAGDATGVAIADRFTRGNGDDVASLIEEKASSLTGEDGQHSAPLIESQGILRVLRCRLLSDTAEGGLIQIRDHMIVVGEVLEVVSRREVKDFGLAYADRRYRRTGGVIEDQR